MTGSDGGSPSRPERGAARRRPSGRDASVPDDEPVLPDVTRDERDVGWGDEPGERDADWYRRERPPHHE
ncbi:MAG TPA: hypothetical protein VFL65_11715 [Jatrophihabitans sp.]|nr:hypothetical protein [Jatrophihabitans sp.]